MYETRRGRFKTYATIVMKILIIRIIVQNLETTLVYYCNSLDATTYFGYYHVILKKQLEGVSFWKFLHFSKTSPFVGQCLHSLPVYLYETLCAIWYHLYNSNNLNKHLWRSVTFAKRLPRLQNDDFSKCVIWATG